LARGYWKCNVSTLSDDYFVTDLKVLYDNLLSDCDGRFSAEQWENFKSRVKSLNIVHSQRLAANRRAELEALEIKLKTLTDKDDIMKCSADIKKLLLYKVESLRIRAKADELTNRDLPTKLLLKRERDRAENKHLEKIVDKGVELTSTSDLITVVHDYYKDLYTCAVFSKS
jgi:hypothetical protein